MRAIGLEGIKAMFTISDFRKALESGAYAWPGGYPMYFVTSDGEALSFRSAMRHIREIVSSIHTHSRDGWRVEGVDVNWEDPDLYCCDTGERIESAYAED